MTDPRDVAGDAHLERVLLEADEQRRAFDLALFQRAVAALIRLHNDYWH